MALIYKTGDLFETPDKAIAHGCNAWGVMGSGVARIVKRKYPWAFDTYATCLRNITDPFGTMAALGECIFSQSDDGSKIVFNLITQDAYGSGRRFVSYDAVDNSVRRMAAQMHSIGIQNVSIPKIGAGLGGGNWHIIAAILESNLAPFTVTVWELE